MARARFFVAHSQFIELKNVFFSHHVITSLFLIV